MWDEDFGEEWEDAHDQLSNEDAVLHLTRSDLRLLGVAFILVTVIVVVFKNSAKKKRVPGEQSGINLDDDVERHEQTSSILPSPAAKGRNHPCSSSVTLSCIPFECPIGRRSPAVAVSHEGDVYTHGGEDDKRLLSDFCVYQQNRVAWEHNIDSTKRSDNGYPGNRAQHTILSCGEYIVLYGGECDPQDSKGENCIGNFVDPALYLFHTPSKEWVRFDLDWHHDAEITQPPGRFGHSMCVCAGHKLVVFGGRGGDDGNTFFNDVWTFDLLQLADDKDQSAEADGRVRWEKLTIDGSSHIPTPRSGHCASVVGIVAEQPESVKGSSSEERMVVLGGEDATGATGLVAPGEIEILDFGTFLWSTIATTGRGPHISAGMSSHTLPIPQLDKLLVIGEQAAVPGIFNEIFVLDTGQQSSTWSRLAIHWHGDWTMVPGRRIKFGSAADDNAAMVFVFGGENDSGMLHDSLIAIDVADLVGDDNGSCKGNSSGLPSSVNGWSTAGSEEDEPLTVSSLREKIVSGRHVASVRR